jgi:dihydrodipicolinate synthase/N-acetylneuraminate lyase
MARRLTRTTLRGVWAPVLLPLRVDGSINWPVVETELEYLADAGVNGVYTNGTAGEFYALTDDEDVRLNHLVASHCRTLGLAFQLGASQMSGMLAVERVRRASALAPSAIQVIFPDWLPLSDDEALDAVRRLADEADGVPLVLYNPPHAKTIASPHLLGVLATAVPTLVGVKVAGGDAEWFSEVRDEVGDLAIFVAGHRLATGLRLGASGSYSNVACLSPRGAVSWYRQMSADPRAADQLEVRINSFLDTHIAPFAAAGYSNAALDKALAAVGGWFPIGTRTKWPQRYLPEDAVGPLRSAASRELPEMIS